MVAGPLAIACAPGGSQFDYTALLVRNCRYDVFLTALFHLPLANVIALLPLTVTLTGAEVLGEAVGWRRMAAILIGFCGMMLIVRPSSSGFNVNTLYALVAVVSVTCRSAACRHRCLLW